MDDLDFPAHREALKLLTSLKYEKFTELQDKAFCSENFWHCKRNFIIGSTSSGKTLVPLIAYFSSEKVSGNRRKMLYAVPYRALASQKQQEFIKKFNTDTEYYDILVSSSEYCGQDKQIQSGDTDIAIVIYEKLYMFISMDSCFLAKYDFLVLDEFGIVESDERGIKSDFVLERASEIEKLKLFILGTPFFNWELYIKKYNFNVIKETRRPVPIDQKVVYKSQAGYNIVTRRGNLKQIAKADASLESVVAHICEEQWKAGKKVIVFVNSQKGTREFSHSLYTKFVKSRLIACNQHDIQETKNEVLTPLDLSEDDLCGIWDKEIDYLSFVSGITFHNASLPEILRERIENGILSEDGHLRIVVATETLAYGLNSNVDVVIVAHMLKPRGNEEPSFLTVNEYQNCIGRAGRLGKSQCGVSYAMVDERNKEEWESLKEKAGTPPIIESKYHKLTSANECAFYLLGLFPTEREQITQSEIYAKVSRIPSVCLNELSVRSIIKQSIAILLKRDLIGIADCLDDEDDSKESEQAYVIKTKGKLLKGFVLEVNSYDKINAAAHDIFFRQPFPLFDFLYKICGTAELMRGCSGIVKKSTQDAKAVLHSFLHDIVNNPKCTAISSSLKDEILHSDTVRKIRENIWTELPDEDAQWLTVLRMAHSLYLWCHGYSMEKILASCCMKYSVVKRIGERASYFTNVAVTAISLNDGCAINERELRRLSTGLYYGLRTELLDILEIGVIEPAEGRKLRIMSTLISLYEDMEGRIPTKSEQRRIEKMKQQISHFPIEYQKIMAEKYEVVI